MNTQIEHMDNHTAKLTVEVAPERMEKAMQNAARRISREVNIPGFRKGKAPYNIVIQRFGVKTVISEAIDILGNDIYKEALEESHIEPYAPGSLEDIETEPAVKLTFVVPKQPEVDLGDYRDIRLPFEVGDVEDSAVTDAVKALQDRRAVVEPAARPAQLGDEIKAHVDATITHPESEMHTGEAGQEVETNEHDEHDEHEEHEGHEHHNHTDPYMEDDVNVVLVEKEDDDEVMPGFSQNLVGLSAGEEKTFTLTFPEDYKQSNLAAHTFTFNVKVEEVKSRTLPVLNDEFAKQVTEGEKETLLDLRIDVRQQLQDAAKREAEGKFADEVLEKLVEQATVKYPEEMLHEYIDDILKNLDRNLRERGLSLDDYKKLEKKDDAALHEEYRDTALKRMKRALILGEIVNKEQLDVDDADVLAQIDKMSAQFGEQAAVFKQMLMRPETKSSIAMDLLTQRALERLVAIARGENPEIGPVPVAEQATSEATQAPTTIDVQATPVASEAEQAAPTNAEQTSAEASVEPTSTPTESETPPTTTEQQQ